VIAVKRFVTLITKPLNGYFGIPHSAGNRGAIS
jgi:hypothetical protein